MTALDVTDLTRRFGDVTAVDAVDADLDDHEILALVGPSGCGKSTLLRLVAGLEPADAGTITLAGVVVDDGRTSLPPERRHVGLVFQEHALFPHLSVSGNVGFGVGDRDRVARVDEMLALVGLDGYGERYPHELSGGERQRVALARALAPRPSLLLLDEPFASLDPNLRARIRRDVVTVLRATDTPAVFVTHDQEEALIVGHRVAVMDRGRIVQLGTPEDVFHAPVDRFVGAFMGEATFLDAEVAGAQLAVEAPSGAELMVRPDDVTFTRSADGSATVIEAEFRGSVWSYLVELGSGDRVRVTRPHTDRVEIGTRVAPAITPGHRPAVITPR